MLRALRNSEIELEVIDLGIKTHVVPGLMTSGRRSVHLRSRTAHAQSKKRSKRQIRTVNTRSACERLIDCASRGSWLNYGEIIEIVVVLSRGITLAGGF